MKKTILSAVLAVLAGAGCGEKVRMTVNCVTTAGPSVECTVVEVEGKGEAEACWDFQVKCENGAIVKAPRSCQKVKNGGTEKMTIPGDKLEGVDKCAGSSPPTATMTNLTINGQKTE